MTPRGNTERSAIFFVQVAHAKNVKPPDIGTGTGITQPGVTRVTLQFDRKSLMHHEEALRITKCSNRFTTGCMNLLA